MTYLDASAIVRAYFADEPAHAAMRDRLLTSDEAMVSSEIVAVEVASAAWRAHRAGRVKRADVVVERFDHHRSVDGPLALITLVPARTLPAARDMVDRHPLTTLDAIHIAVALDLPGEVTFLTADRRQADAAVETGLAVELVG